MTKKRMALLAVLPLSMIVMLGVLAMLPPRPGVTKANFNRIEMGMTIGEVEEIFGEEGSRSNMNAAEIYWAGDDLSLASVWFINDRVGGMSWHAFDEEATLDKIRRWLHLPVAPSPRSGWRCP